MSVTPTASVAPPDWFLAAQKLSSHPWADKPLDLSTLRVIRLDEEDGYQRPEKNSRIDYLVDHMNPLLARTIVVSHRGNPNDKTAEQVVIDGQHTLKALQRVGITHWMCRVVYNMTPEQEAAIFIEQESNFRRIPGVVQHNAEVMAGEDIAKAIDAVLSSKYLRISTSKLRTKDGYIGVSSRATYEKILNWGGPTLLSEVLQLSIDAWKHRKESFNNRVLAGIGWMLAAFEGAPFDRARLVTLLQNTTPKLIEEKMGATGSGGAGHAGAIAILAIYLEGGIAPYDKIRKGTKEAPTLPDTFSAKDYKAHDFWTAETAQELRSVVTPFTAPPKPEKAPKETKAEKAARLAVNESAPGVAATNGTAEAEVSPEASESLQEVDLTPDAAETSDPEVLAPVGSSESDGDWEYKDPASS